MGINTDVLYYFLRSAVIVIRDNSTLRQGRLEKNDYFSMVCGRFPQI